MLKATTKTVGRPGSQRVSGWCEPIERCHKTHHFRAEVLKLYARCLRLPALRDSACWSAKRQRLLQFEWYRGFVMLVSRTCFLGRFLWYKPVYAEGILHGKTVPTKVVCRSPRIGIVEITIEGYNQNNIWVLGNVTQTIVKSAEEYENEEFSKLRCDHR